MVTQEGAPSLGGRPGSLDHVLRDAGLRDLEAKLEQLAMDARRTPEWVGIEDLADQPANVVIYRSAPWPRPPAPVEPKAGAMPANDGARFDNQQDIGPAGPDAAEVGPEEAVTSVQGWPRSLAFEHGELLAESEDFQGGIDSRADENAKCNRQRKTYHELTVVARRDARLLV